MLYNFTIAIKCYTLSHVYMQFTIVYFGMKTNISLDRHSNVYKWADDPLVQWYPGIWTLDTQTTLFTGHPKYRHRVSGNQSIKNPDIET